MLEINWKKSNFAKWLYGYIVVLLIIILVYTRFINLGWGLPYPMHPDERNMANAVQNLNCSIKYQASGIKECFNPHFFAYGQFPLYLGYFGVMVMKFFDGDLGTPVIFQEATLSLRIISASVSVITVFVLLGILGLFGRLGKKNIIHHSLFIILLTFSPALIQLAHFGTTESLLILFYSLIIYFSLLFVQKKLPTTNYLLLTSLFSGLALATKVSSLPYLIMPLFLVSGKSFWKAMIFLFFTFFFFILFSPHNIISFNEFVSSLRYESDVAAGKTHVFYTRQFSGTMPIAFQLTKIFPYVMGWPVFGLGGLGLLGVFGRLGKQKEVNLLRAAFLIVFLPNAFMFAKWTRFMTPVFPIMIVFAVLFFHKIKIIKIIKVIMVLIIIIPGIAYLSVYRNPDVRFQASEWIYKNIQNGAYILTETANVVDLPLPDKSYNGYKNYRIISFNFYDLDQNPILQEELKYHLSKANYIIIPSRRIFKNHPKNRYPVLDAYYQSLFSGELGFKEIARFESFPKICFMFHASCFALDDEDAEETWTVFDHPVIRIYERI